MAKEIANPLDQLAAAIYERAKPSTRERPVPSELKRTAGESIDSVTAKQWINTHLAGQQTDALSGNGEQYRPEEPEAQGVPLSTEIPGFIEDFRSSLRTEFLPHLPDRIRDGHHHNSRGELAEKFYEMAAGVKSFRGAGTHKFITCLELAGRFDENIKYRLAEQIVRAEREKSNLDEADVSPSRDGARIREIVGLIDGITHGKVSLHPQQANAEDEQPATRSPAKESAASAVR